MKNILKTPHVHCLAVCASLMLAAPVYAKDCSKDQAMEMYSQVQDHATALVRDAESNPSKIPFQKGKNDPRIKKAKKIKTKSEAIQSDYIAKEQYPSACEALTSLSSKYGIPINGEVAAKSTNEKVKDGVKAGLQSKSLIDRLR